MYKWKDGMKVTEKNDLYVFNADNGARAIARTRKGAYKESVMCN